MEEQIKKIYEKQKNGRIRMIRNVLLIYAALICVVSISKEIRSRIRRQYSFSM